MVKSGIKFKDFFISIGLFVFLFSTIETSFASDISLIDAKRLSGKVSDWKILDARPKKEWLREHIPGSVSFSWEDYTRTDNAGIKYRVLPPVELAKFLGLMGINENTPLVVYGDADSSWGGEGWNCWALSWLGHKGQIHLLSGGIQAWKNNRLPLITGDEKIKVIPVKYTYKINSAVDITTDELMKNKSSFTLVDTRSTLEWFKGHISGAKHIPWENFFTGKNRTPLNSAELKELLEDHGVDLKKPVVYYCAGGIRSAFAWTVHYLSDLAPARNYEGGMEAWKASSK